VTLLFVIVYVMNSHKAGGTVAPNGATARGGVKHTPRASALFTVDEPTMAQPAAPIALAASPMAAARASSTSPPRAPHALPSLRSESTLRRLSALHEADAIVSAPNRGSTISRIEVAPQVMQVANRLDNKIESAELLNQQLMDEIRELEEKENELNAKLGLKDDWFTAQVRTKEQKHLVQVEAVEKSRVRPNAAKGARRGGGPVKVPSAVDEQAGLVLKAAEQDIASARQTLASAKTSQHSRFEEKMQQRRDTAALRRDTQPAGDSALATAADIESMLAGPAMQADGQAQAPQDAPRASDKAAQSQAFVLAKAAEKEAAESHARAQAEEAALAARKADLKAQIFASSAKSKKVGPRERFRKSLSDGPGESTVV